MSDKIADGLQLEISVFAFTLLPTIDVFRPSSNNLTWKMVGIPYRLTILLRPTKIEISSAPAF